MVLLGKYKPAMALLRRYMETFLVALYFDLELKKYKKNSKTFEHFEKEKERWIRKGRRFRFRGEYGLVERLVNPDTDYVALEVMKNTSTSFSKSSFRKYIEEIYSNLSKSVHFGGINLPDDMLITFSEYNDELFKEWYSRLLQVHEICNLLLVINFPSIVEHYEQYSKKEIEHERRIPLLLDSQIKILKEQGVFDADS
ncbi:hypothetical protein CW704_02115 [Candidatus Bathyarchaeota archaeon]|nr:MAG: hypothetical protein CW704_02115 [Candidatus Bathyarchaeota archaeon]